MQPKTKTVKDIKLKQILKDKFVERMISLIERFQESEKCTVDINYEASIRLKK